MRWPGLSVGLAAEDDIFRVHVRSFAEPGAVGLADTQLGLAAGAEHTLEWSVYPLPNGDYWDFVNALRRNWGANYTIPRALAFDPAASAQVHDLERHRHWLQARRLGMVCSGQTYFIEAGAQPKDYLAEGTAIPLAASWCANTADWVRKMHTVAPDAKLLVYLHSQICTEPKAETLYADSKLFDAAGKQVTSPYRSPVYVYLSTLENSYGRALLKALPVILDATAADGIYCDEWDWASVRYAYQAPWDGCTVDIDPATHALGGKRSSVTLLQQPWKTAMVKLLRERGKLILGNGPPGTRTMLGLHVPRFTEMASYSFLVQTHLASPWGLGNHEAEASLAGRAHLARRFLDYAGVYTPYAWDDEPSGVGFVHLMYPITPAELRPGVVLGEERILTNRSGRFGWPDGAAAEVHVIGPDGHQVSTPAGVCEVRSETGLRLTELRLPSDHFAVLVRK